MARVRGHNRPGTILVVCHGNICRSPFAAAALRRALPVDIRERSRIDSAGFLQADRSCPPGALAVAAAYGLDLSSHRSSVLSPGSVGRASLIVVMTATQRRAILERYGRAHRNVIVLGDLDPHPIRTRAVPDPIDGPLRKYQESFGRIDRCIQTLATNLASNSGAGAVRT